MKVMIGLVRVSKNANQMNKIQQIQRHGGEL